MKKESMDLDYNRNEDICAKLHFYYVYLLDDSLKIFQFYHSINPTFKEISR